jgi:molecular chaperone GrpE
MSSENPTGAANVPQDGTETAAAQAAGETPTAAQVEEWRAAALKLAEANERHLRLYADFENFKKRAQRERDETRRAAVESVLGRLLPVVDTFEMAMMAAQMPGTSVETLRAGVQMIQGQLRGVLGEFGVEEIDAMGKPFDPLFHEAVSQQETLDVPEGQVVQQMRRGYRCRERLLRAASVVVARPPASGASQTVAEQGDAPKA